MNTFWKVTIGAAIVTGFLLVRRQVKLLYAYSVKIKKVVVGITTLEKLELFIDVEVFNKSSIGFEITGYEFDAFLNNLLVAKVKNKDSRFVKPKSSAIVTLKVTTSPKRVFNIDNLTALLSALNPKTLMIKVKGILSAKSGIVNIANIPIDFEETLANILKKKDEKENKS